MKNKGKILDLRAKKKKAKDVARRSVVRMARRMTRSIPHIGNIRDVNLDAPTLKNEILMDENGTLPLPVCDGVGECCKRPVLSVFPVDVWNILHSKSVNEKHGPFRSTMDLYQGDNRLLTYYISQTALTPVCTVERRKFGEDKDDYVCPFFIDDSKSCMLGDDRLTVCVSNPMMRILRRGQLKNIEGFSYAPLLSCSGCSKNDPYKLATQSVRDIVESRGGGSRYAEVQFYYAIMEWLRVVRNESMAKFATMLMFDWHRVMAGASGELRDDDIANGPTSSQDVVASAWKIIQGIATKEAYKENSELGQGEIKPEVVEESKNHE